jgi:hypothetical protein
MYQWAAVHTGSNQVRARLLHTLDEAGQPQGSPNPPAVLQAANRNPKPLLPLPTRSDDRALAQALEGGGHPPAQRVIFMRAGQPPDNWFGGPTSWPTTPTTHTSLPACLPYPARAVLQRPRRVSLMFGGARPVVLMVVAFRARISRRLKSHDRTAERIAAGDYTRLPDPATPATAPPGCRCRRRDRPCPGLTHGRPSMAGPRAAPLHPPQRPRTRLAARTASSRMAVLESRSTATPSSASPGERRGGELSTCRECSLPPGRPSRTRGMKTVASPLLHYWRAGSPGA